MIRRLLRWLAIRNPTQDEFHDILCAVWDGRKIRARELRKAVWAVRPHRTYASFYIRMSREMERDGGITLTHEKEWVETYDDAFCVDTHFYERTEEGR